jgi:energy-converting hydrogenase Eha subunit B
MAMLCWSVPGLYLASLRHWLGTRGWVQTLFFSTLGILSIAGLWLVYRNVSSPKTFLIGVACLVPIVHFALIELAIRGFKGIARRAPDIAFRGSAPMADRFFSLGVLALCVLTLVPLALLSRHDA